MNDATQTLTEPLHLTVDYGQCLEAMIAAGHYDWTNTDITSVRFPIKGEEIVPIEAKLFHFDRYLSSEDVVEAIKTADAKNPWEPAKIERLLSFGATHPDEQRKFPIIALGSVAEVDGDHVVPSLCGFGGERHLDLDWWCGDWGDDCRFLAVRNLSSGA